MDFSKTKLSVGGAMALEDNVIERWLEITGTKVIEGYGLTEASPVVCCNPVDDSDRRGTIGLPLPNTDVKLVNNEGEVVPRGEAGELCCKGPQVMKGYWQRPEESAKVLKEGWLCTGDVAVMKEDGFFKIVDRKKDMILVSGFNVYPNEIENVLSGHPAVNEVAAVGVPDAKSGEAVKVFVSKKAPVTEEELKEFARKNLTAYKVPRFIEFRGGTSKNKRG